MRLEGRPIPSEHPQCPCARVHECQSRVNRTLSQGTSGKDAGRNSVALSSVVESERDDQGGTSASSQRGL